MAFRLWYQGVNEGWDKITSLPCDNLDAFVALKYVTWPSYQNYTVTKMSSSLEVISTILLKLFTVDPSTPAGKDLAIAEQMIHDLDAELG